MEIYWSMFNYSCESNGTSAFLLLTIMYQLPDFDTNQTTAFLYCDPMMELLGKWISRHTKIIHRCIFRTILGLNSGIIRECEFAEYKMRYHTVYLHIQVTDSIRLSSTRTTIIAGRMKEASVGYIIEIPTYRPIFKPREDRFECAGPLGMSPPQGDGSHQGWVSSLLGS